MAHDGLLPLSLAKVHKKYHTPHKLTVMSGMAIAILSSTLPIGVLQNLSAFGTLSTFTIVCIGTVYLRYAKPNMKRDFECPMMPFVPLAGISLFLLIIASLPLHTFIHAGLWIAFLLTVYFMYGRHNSVLLHPNKKRS